MRPRGRGCIRLTAACLPPRPDEHAAGPLARGHVPAAAPLPGGRAVLDRPGPPVRQVRRPPQLGPAGRRHRPRRPGELPLRGRPARSPAPRRHPGRWPRRAPSPPWTRSTSSRSWRGWGRARRWTCCSPCRSSRSAGPTPAAPATPACASTSTRPRAGARREHRPVTPARRVPPAQRAAADRRPGHRRLTRRSRSPGSSGPARPRRRRSSTRGTSRRCWPATAGRRCPSGVIGEVYNRVGKMVKQLAKQVRDQSITFDSNAPERPQDLRAAADAQRGLRGARRHRARRRASTR